MRLIDLTLPTPEENLALDEALLLESRDGETEVLRFWESSVPFVVLGVAGRLREEVDLEGVRRDEIPVLRRASGGGTVLQGPGCLNFSLVLSLETRPEFRDVTRSYRAILGRVADALEPGRILQRGTSDLACGEQKVSGNAQKRTRHALLVHHGTVLYDFDLESIPRYLREPERQPAYRQRRGHRDFVRNVALSRNAITERLAGAWGANAPSGPVVLPELGALVREKYSNVEWIERF